MGAAPRRVLLVLGLLLAQAAAFVPGGAASLPHVRPPHAASRSSSGPIYLRSQSGPADLPRLPGAPVRALDVIAEWAASPAFAYRVEDDIDRGRRMTAELLDTPRVIELTRGMLRKMRACVEARAAEYVVALVPRGGSGDIRALATVARRGPAVEVLNHVARPRADWRRDARTPLIHELVRWVNGTSPVIVRPWGYKEEMYYKSLGFRPSEAFAPLWEYAGPAEPGPADAAAQEEEYYRSVGFGPSPASAPSWAYAAGPADTGLGDAADQVPGPVGSGAEPQAEQDMQIVALDIEP